MLSRPLAIVFALLLTACTSGGPPGNREDSGSHAIEREQAKIAQAAYDNEKARLTAKLDQANTKVQALAATVHNLEQTLAALESENRSLNKHKNTVEKLRRDISSARADRNAARKQAKQLEKSLRDMSQAVADLTEAQSSASHAGTAEPDAKSELYLVDPHSGVEGATTVELFYATNRARLNLGIADQVRPLWPVLALAVLTITLLLCTRIIIKTRFQRPALVAVGVTAGVAMVYFLFSGAQTILQIRQTQQLNPVLYGNHRLQPGIAQQPFELGTCKVSIPPVHQRSVVELPKITHFEFRYDAAKHFVLSAVSPSSDTAFYEKLQQRVSASNKRDVFVFVHGFHNTFQDAAFRTAQIAHDLEFPGAPIFFSWPSQGAVLDYAADENNVKVAVFDLQAFLEQLRERSGAQRIHLIAHSMGSRALSRAIAAMSTQHKGAPLFNEMILAAPDIDAQVLDRLSESIASAVERITLYASSRDEALSASRFIHGQTYQRAGETIPVPLVNRHMDTIDVSDVTSGHSYIAGSGHILGDLSDILSNSRPLNEAIANKVIVGNGQYWIMK